MPALSTWNLDPTRILTRRELTTVLADLTARATRYANSQRNLIIVRLACCCEAAQEELDKPSQNIAVDCFASRLARAGRVQGAGAHGYGQVRFCRLCSGPG